MRKSLALRISGPILLVVSLIFILTTYLNYKNMVNTQLQQEQKQYNLISQNIINDMSTVFDKARLGLSSVVENPAIQKAFADRDREELLELTMPIFKKANEEGIDQFQFHVAPAVSFLRLHQPEKYDDDLSSFRFTVLECNKTQKLVEGLEEGKGGFGFRVVMPIFYEGEHIGSVEYGPGLNDTLVKKWQQQMGGEYYIYATAQTGVSWESKEDGLLVSTLKDDPYKVESNEIKNTLAYNSAKTVYIDEEQKAALLIPLKDYTGKAVGYVKVIQDRIEVLNNLNAILVNSIIRVLLALLIVLATTIYIARSITKPLVQLSEAAEVVAQGDLTKEIDVFTSKDEIGVLTSAFKRMIYNLKSLLAEIQDSTESLSSYSQQLAASNEEVSASMEEIASTTDKVANTSAESSQVAQTAIADSEQVQKVAQEGNEAVNQTVEKIHYIASATTNVSEAIQKLSEHSTQIGEIINVISEIAEQTNLLSLNAAIEAARAGEHGRGFAVVADEVGKLAEQSARAAKDITGLIKEIQSGIGEAKGAIDKGNQEVNEGTQIAGYAGSSLQEIITAVSKNTMLIKDLANGFNKSNEGTLELTNSYQQIAATMQEVAAAAQELANIANQLQTNVIKFKI